MFIRPLELSHYDELVQLWNRSGLAYRPRGRDSRHAIEEQMAKDPGGFLGAFADGLLVGSVIATFEGRKGWINRLAVDPAHRRRGVAKRLVAAAEEELRHRGARIMAALVEESNAASLAFFQQLGYQVRSDVLYLSKRDDQDV